MLKYLLERIKRLELRQAEEFKSPRKSHTPDVVYIVESCRSDENFEGKELSGILENSVYLPVTNKKDFFNLTHTVCHDFESRKGKLHAMPYFYFSFHGDDDGIALQDGDILTWIEVLKIMNEIHGIFLGVRLGDHPDNLKIPLFTAVCSICNSFATIQKLSSQIEVPFQAWIASEGPITPKQALEAYTYFFKFARDMKTSVPEAVSRINNSFDFRLGLVTFFDNQKPSGQ